MDRIIGVNVGPSVAEGIGMEFGQDIISKLMRIRRNKLPFFQRNLRAMSFIRSMFGRDFHPVRHSLRQIKVYFQSMA